MAVSTKPNFFLRRPVLSSVISIVITLVGALAMKALPIAQYPDLVPPTVNVSAAYPGASAPGRYGKKTDAGADARLRAHHA